MKTMMKLFMLKGLALLVFFVAAGGANVVCSMGNYQDKLPESVKKLRKF